MKNLLIIEKIAKVVELKQLQKEVKSLRNKEKSSNDEVTMHQYEA